MSNKSQKPLRPEEVPELRSDRDDALGYSREQFDFGDEKNKPTPKMPVKKSRKPRKKSKR